ncbi:DMT family transporter [Marinomonas epiphytica]
MVMVAFALIAFAANSVLCRLALAEGLIDPVSFTSIRLFSGALTLVLLVLFQLSNQKRQVLSLIWHKGSWKGAVALFVYALGFSYAYVSLATGLGALVLFGAVQLTLIVLAVYVGQKLSSIEWLGLIIAFASFVYLVSPSMEGKGSLLAVFLMMMAGIAWGAYTWFGKGVQDPLMMTAAHFIRTMPFLLLLLVVTFSSLQISALGVLWAVLSGAIMSGLGYALWYAVLPSISTSSSAVLQLLVPVIATVGGQVFAGESVTMHLIIASVGVLGGVLMVILGKKKL